MSATTATATSTRPTRPSNLKAMALAAQQVVKQEKDTQKELNALKYQERNKRVQEHITSLADELVRLAYEKSESAAAKGYGWVKIAEYFLPGNDTVFDPATKENVLVPRNPHDLTYWSGSDTAENASPIVLLLQGVRNKETGAVRPDLLPGGKTALDVAQSILATEEAEIRLVCRFFSKHKSLIVTAIWIEDDWQAFLASQDAKFASYKATKTKSYPAKPRATSAVEAASSVKA